MNPCTLGWYLPLLVKDAPVIGAEGDFREMGISSEREGLSRRSDRTLGSGWFSAEVDINVLLRDANTNTYK